MRPETMQQIAVYFPGSKWTSEESKKYQESFRILEPLPDEDVLEGCKSMRATLTRTHCSAEELAGEIKRLQRRKAITLVARKDYVDERDVERDRTDIQRLLLLATREEVAKGVAYARRIGAISTSTLDADISKWTSRTRGIVWAAMEREGVFK
jgi:hypothetical protein